MGRLRDIIVGNIVSISVGIVILTFFNLQVDRSLTRSVYSVHLRT